MTNNANQVVVGGNGHLWVAAVGATAPFNTATAMPAGWVDLGYISEDGATFSFGRETTDIGAWQSMTPIRKIVTAQTITVAAALRQWSQPTIEFALGGDVVTSASEFKWEPAAPEVIDERALTLEWIDGTKSYRLYFRRGMVSEAVETQFTRTAASDLPITYSALDPGGVFKICSLFSSDPAMSAVS